MGQQGHKHLSFETAITTMKAAYWKSPKLEANE